MKQTTQKKLKVSKSTNISISSEIMTSETQLSKNKKVQLRRPFRKQNK